MAILKDCTFYYIRLNQPNARYNKDNPTWECQIRTTDPNQADEWEKVGLTPKLMRYGDDYEDKSKRGDPILSEDGKKQYRVTLQKRSLRSKETKEPAEPVQVVDADLNPVDLSTTIILNGSKGHVRIATRDRSDGKPGKLATLTGIQLTYLVKGTASTREEFEAQEGGTTVVDGAPRQPSSTNREEGDESGEEDDFVPASKSSVPSAPGRPDADAY